MRSDAACAPRRSHLGRKSEPETPLRLSRLSTGLHNDENYVKRAAIEFPFALAPKPLEWIEAAPGILWLRLPLPFRLDHVNVYLIEDGDGFALIDTGIDNTVSREIWQALFEGPLRDRPLTRILARIVIPTTSAWRGGSASASVCRFSPARPNIWTRSASCSIRGP